MNFIQAEGYKIFRFLPQTILQQLLLFFCKELLKPDNKKKSPIIEYIKYLLEIPFNSYFIDTATNQTPLHMLIKAKCKEVIWILVIHSNYIYSESKIIHLALEQWFLVIYGFYNRSKDFSLETVPNNFLLVSFISRKRRLCYRCVKEKIFC